MEEAAYTVYKPEEVKSEIENLEHSPTGLVIERTDADTCSVMPVPPSIKSNREFEVDNETLEEWVENGVIELKENESKIDE